jgi:CxxC motif-containing protein
VKARAGQPGKGPAELVCIACPIACRLTVAQTDDGTVSVAGNRCPKGELYGREEMLAPRRVVTAVVPTSSMDFPCVPVRTDTPVSRDLVMELLKGLYRLRVDLPVRNGQVLVEDFHGARVIVTRTLPPDQVSPVR